MINSGKSHKKIFIFRVLIFILVLSISPMTVSAQSSGLCPGLGQVLGEGAICIEATPGEMTILLEEWFAANPKPPGPWGIAARAGLVGLAAVAGFTAGLGIHTLANDQTPAETFQDCKDAVQPIDSNDINAIPEILDTILCPLISFWNDANSEFELTPFWCGNEEDDGGGGNHSLGHNVPPGVTPEEGLESEDVL